MGPPARRVHTLRSVSVTPEEAPPRAVLAAWSFEEATVRPIRTGLINRTFAVERDGKRFILQRLHPVFAADVNLDIEAVTARLERSGVTTPRPVPTRDGALWVESPDGVWRALTFLDGDIVTTVSGAGVAREAGRLVARFHRALTGFDHRFRFSRPGAHDTPRHLAHLRQTVSGGRDHARFAEVRPVAERILALGDALPPLGDLPRRIVHGDLKITNILFSSGLERAVALIDLDTLAWGTVAVELGDALRSWCNAAGEDEPAARFEPGIFEAAVQGYAVDAGGLLEEREIGAIAPGLETIALELAARFCADALEESYFGWDPERFASRGEHNLVRARSQLSLAQAVGTQREPLQRIVEEAFGRAPRPDASPHQGRD